jgi:tetratricopeptide (TPR) repeat protein
LTTAGAYLHTSNFTFERYLQEYEERWYIDPRRPLQLQEYQDRTLYTTWDLSYTRLESEDPDAAKLLKLLAYFDNQSIWYELLHAGAADDSPEWLHEVIADDNFARVMRTLTDYCFIEVQKSTKSWSMHNCVHDWTLAALNKDIDAEQYWYAFDCIVSSINKDDGDSLRHLSYAHLAAHATRLVQDRFRRNDLLNDIIPDRLDGASYIAQLLERQIQLTAAEQMYLRALAGCEQTLGPEHTSTLATVNNLGILYRDQGKLAQAEQFYLRALAGKEQALGPEHKSTLDTVSNLGVLYYTQSKLTQAEQFYLRALAGYERALGPEHTSTLNTVNNLGGLYRDQGKLAQAEQFCLRALAGYEQALGPEHTSTLGTVNNLGILYGDQGKLAQAERFFLRALAGYEQALQLETIPVLNTVRNLGLLYRGQRQMEKAEKMFQRAVLGHEKVLGPDHLQTLAVVNDLSKLRVTMEGGPKVRSSHNSSRRRDRLKSLLPLRTSRAGHS